MVRNPWWKDNAEAVRAAVDAAERASGHQIVVRVGTLGRRPARTADRIAMRWRAASLVFCVDAARRHFEVRWADNVGLDGDRVRDAVTGPLREHDLAAAVTALAALLPRREEGEELPDIVHD
jgi:hypothetical protein